jgi:ATP-dependent DNA helicase RecG
MTNEIVLDDEKVFAKLGKMGIHNPEQLLLHLPSEYIDCRAYRNLIELPFGQAELKIYSVAVVSTPSTIAGKVGKPPRLEFYVTDDIGTRAKAVVFGAIDTWKAVKIGQKFCLQGRVGEFRDELNITDLAIIPATWLGKVVPIYKGKKSVISSEYISNQIYAHLDRIPDTVAYLERHFDGMSSSEILSKANLTHFGAVSGFLNAIHNPSSIKQGLDAILGAKKLSAFEILWLSKKRSMRSPEPLSRINIDFAIVKALINKLPFELTNDQSVAIQNICDGLISPYALFTLLSGDVGTGKTAVFGVCAAASKVAKAKVAILLPNLLLVKQTKKKLNQWWQSMPTLAITGKTKITAADLANDPVVIGTTAMFARLEKEGWVPDFVIADEQAKFAVSQRERLVSNHTNLLEATATCVPRSAALIMNGGMDMVVLRECPVKKQVVSRIIGRTDRERLVAHIRKVIEAGGQAAILYPNVKVTEQNIAKMEEAKDANKKYIGARKKSSAVDTVEMWEKLFPGRVGLVHGKMTDDEKINVIERLDAKEIDLLVSTTIIEAGIDTPSLRTVAVIDAYKFGIAQLHQIRGRVARAGGMGYFFMYNSKEVQEEALQRLSAVEKEPDGFVLAEIDMELRGFGDLSEDSSQQSGISRGSLFTGIKIKPSDLREFISADLKAA